MILPNRNFVEFMAPRAAKGLDFVSCWTRYERLLFAISKATWAQKAVMIAQTAPSLSEGCNQLFRHAVFLHPLIQVFQNPSVAHKALR